MGFASNSIAFAAERAARYASVRGGASGHAATTADVQGVAREYASPLDPSAVGVTVTWTPNNNPGSNVQVKVTFSLVSIQPLSSGAVTLQSTAQQTVTQ
jgi:hypothetical protein